MKEIDSPDQAIRKSVRKRVVRPEVRELLLKSRKKKKIDSSLNCHEAEYDEDLQVLIL